MSFQRNVLVLFTAMTMSMSMPMRSSHAAVFAIAPVAWGGVLAGAGIMAGGGGIIFAGEKAKTKGVRLTSKVFGGLLVVVGFLVMDDQSVNANLNAISTENAELVEIFAKNKISIEEIKIYNSQRDAYATVLETAFSEEGFSELSPAKKSEAVHALAMANGISPATLKVAGVVGGIAAKISK